MDARETSCVSGIVLPKAKYLEMMTNHEFYELCRANPDWQFERTAEGEVIGMPPTGGETGRKNFQLTLVLGTWVERDGTGIGFDSSTAFRLPNGATRSPDAAWILRSRWEALSAEEREEFAPVCPDFVVELRSRRDRLTSLQDKMEEYVQCGARLGWLIDPLERRVYVYRPGEPVEVLENPATVEGDPVLPGFVLATHQIW